MRCCLARSRRRAVWNQEHQWMFLNQEHQWNQEPQRLPAVGALTVRSLRAGISGAQWAAIRESRRRPRLGVKRAALVPPGACPLPPPPRMLPHVRPSGRYMCGYLCQRVVHVGYVGSPRQGARHCLRRCRGRVGQGRQRMCLGQGLRCSLRPPRIAGVVVWTAARRAKRWVGPRWGRGWRMGVRVTARARQRLERRG